MDVTVGTAPVNWNNEDVPDYRPWTPYQQMLDEMREAGYDATEFSAQFPADPAQAKSDLAARGLRPASTFLALNLRAAQLLAGEAARAEARATYVRALGGSVLIVADDGDAGRRAVAGHVTPKDGLDDASWRQVARGAEEVGRRCSALGIRIVFHNHVGTYVETEDELARLLDLTDPTLVGLCFDVGHALYGGGDIARIMNRYGERVGYVHLKDVDLSVLDRCRREKLGWHEALYAGIFTEFGAGGVDFARFFAALEARAYRGWLIVEQDTTRMTPLESARMNREYLRRTFGL